jgi:tRNA threonylcarbamoyladenosine biosynthesis protein TsaE
MIQVLCRDPEETRLFAREIIPHLAPGVVFLLAGPLGAGKTTLVRGVLRGMGWEGPVRSPSFSIIQTYPTQPPLLHADLYRVATAGGLDLDELLEDHAALVEWPEAGASVWAGREVWSVDFQVLDDARLITVSPPSP